MKKLWVIGIVLILLVAGFLVFGTDESESSDIYSNNLENGQFENVEVERGGENSGNGNEECEAGHVIFDFPPVNLEKTKIVVPLGLMSGNHVTPVDHQYFQNFDNEIANIEVYSPGAGVVKDMQYMFGSYMRDGKQVEWADYRIEIDHGCSVSSFYIHIDKLSDKLMGVAPAKGEYAQVNVEVEAGEIIGWYSSNVDYNIVDEDVVLPGLLVPEHYASEAWKIHFLTFFLYFKYFFPKVFSINFSSYGII